MSEVRPSSFRYSPKVSPEASNTDERVMAARTLLGLDLGPHGLWGNPVRATAYWAWVRDGREIARDDLAGFHDWIATFLGLVGEQSEPARHFTLGFVQGVECALRRVALPDAVFAGVGSRPFPSTSDLPAQPGAKPLQALRDWAAGWLAAEAGTWERISVWELGLVMACRATREGHLLCGLLSAEFDRARAEQRFAARALAGFLLHPGTELWEQFVRATYPDGCPEGRAIAESTRRSLDHAKAGRWRLREFFLHALESGRDFARSHPHEADRVVGVLGPEARAALEREFAATTGPLDQIPKPEVIFLALKNWLLETHPDLLEPRDTGAENMVLRHSYDYLWWRGLLSRAPSLSTNNS